MEGGKSTPQTPHGDASESEGEPTRYGPTDSMARHPGVEGHGDHRDRHVAEISAELNRRSPFIQDLERHARDHPPGAQPGESEQ
jgi:hypothetical protein